MSLSALGAGFAGMQNYQRAMDMSAARVASASQLGGTTATDDLASSMVGTLAAKDGFQIAAKVVKAADEMLGTLIDTHA
ncbi:hypothetical protein IGB42_04067 [Andreprevotia sp. IGB-42]|uniref:flagellar basal body rod C-terminal domain-containing protein n=1 Tax=Andreprevotia sp. IGB-42 TaxID=2497473 RepID=UPI00135AAB63|nr:flagellar basal body rod C-terminal domain-containing protein [Andreprevotia sp. IGB-42]KAF0811449.1 hypothetical protein IGB42_04067 [Andreprevotia sp. IGB-42]